MKTTASLATVTQFLTDYAHAVPESVRPLKEGHVSQAFCFRIKEGKFVFRLAPTDKHFQADKLACSHFGKTLLIPAIQDIGKFQDEIFYCVSEYVEGAPSDGLSDAEMDEALPAIQRILAQIYQADISFSHGYGDIDVRTGTAEYSTWKEHIEESAKVGRFATHANAKHIGLPISIVDNLYEQYRANVTFASETRRLLHGDPGFDNLLIKDGKVVAVIDWAQMGYGDWVSDFARLDFWAPGRYGDMYAFAEQYDLDRHNLMERKALYWAINGLWAIEFADRAQSKPVTKWLHENIFQKHITP